MILRHCALINNNSPALSGAPHDVLRLTNPGFTLAWWITVSLLLCLGLPSRLAGAQPSPRAARVHAEVQSILSGRDFRVETAGRGWLTRMGERLSGFFERIARFFERLFRFGRPAGGRSGNALYWILLATLVAGMAWLIAWAVRRWERGGGRRKAARPQALVFDDEPVNSLDSEEWLRLAERHASAGEYRRAFRAAFVALVLQLDRAGFLRFDRARTNGEYLRILRARPPIYALMAPLAADFDACWYGHRPAREDDYRRCLAAHARVRTEQAG